MVRPVSRTTVRDWYGAGLELLAEKGAEALSLAALCERVGVTKGSFYHHFDTMAAFHEGMLDHWAGGPTDGPSIDLGGLDAHARLSLLRQMAVESAHETEVAVRAWASWYELAARALRRVERRRHRVLATNFEQLGLDEAHAATLARVGVYLMAGVQSDIDKVDRALLDEVLTEYQRWIEASLPAT